MVDSISIGALSRQTGVSTHTIRVWESRHGLLSPKRSAGGTRLFNGSDVHRVRMVRDLVEKGHALAALAKLDNEQLHELLDDSLPLDESTPDARALRAEFEVAIEALDKDGAQRTLARGAMLLEPTEFLQHMVLAAMVRIGQRWHDGTLRVAHEHLATNAVRSLMFSLANTYPVTRQGGAVLAATLPTESHEVGALASALCAQIHGWKTIYLGTQLPAEEIVYVAAQVPTDKLLLSCVAGEMSVLQSQIESLERELPPRVQLLVGGRQQDSLRLARAQAVSSLTQLEELLR